jgi:hypothetical protein
MRLPKGVRPTAYSLHWVLDPDLDHFTGTVTIDVVADAVPVPGAVFLHAGKQLIITAATVNDAPVTVTRVPNDEVVQVPIGSASARLHFAFRAPFSTSAKGMYKWTAGAIRGVATQFQACAARTAVPCFDEPGFKATFTVAVTAPPGVVVLSNMPVASVEGGRHQFATTPVMSTYLLATVVGPLRTTTPDAIVRVWTYDNLTPAAAEHAREYAAAVLQAFDELLGSTYPLPKLDLVPVPDFDAGAMENWGLVTFRPGLLLGSDTVLVHDTIAHELAHQWFGNLVTMAWWDDVWLNESFATFASALVRQVVQPDVDPWPTFCDSETIAALAADALQASRPIQSAPDATPDAIEQLFDVRAYNKGASVLRMLFLKLGSDVFLGGVRKYLHTYAYKTATAADLWTSVGEECRTTIQPWLTQRGFPVVTYDGSGGPPTQRRFLLTPTADAATAPDLCLQCSWPVTVVGDGTDTWPNWFFATPCIIVGVDYDLAPHDPTTTLSKLASAFLGTEAGLVDVTVAAKFVFKTLTTSTDEDVVRVADTILQRWVLLCGGQRTGAPPCVLPDLRTYIGVGPPQVPATTETPDALKARYLRAAPGDGVAILAALGTLEGNHVAWAAKEVRPSELAYMFAFQGPPARDEAARQQWPQLVARQASHGIGALVTNLVAHARTPAQLQAWAQFFAELDGTTDAYTGAIAEALEAGRVRIAVTKVLQDGGFCSCL